MRFCGQSYESVWVNANGNLTFGAASAAFVESPAGLLIGPPRIAGVWDDLNPAAGGEVSFSQSAHALTVRFTGVPEFALGGANSFSITLSRTPFDGSSGFALHGGIFSLDYGAISATDGLAGYSCGGKTTSGFELETNLSALHPPVVVGLDKPAIYELFSTGDNDLDNEHFVVITPKPLRDPFEPNNTLSRATHVNLPFSTEDRLLGARSGRRRRLLSLQRQSRRHSRCRNAAGYAARHADRAVQCERHAHRWRR